MIKKTCFNAHLFASKVLLEGVTCASQLRRRLQEAAAVRFKVGSLQRSQADVPRDRRTHRQHQKELLVEDLAL